MEEEYATGDEIDGDDREKSSEDELDYDDDRGFSVDDAFVKEEKFRSDVIEWALENQITRSALQKVGAIFNDFIGKKLLPKDSRTLLHTPRTVEISTLDVDQKYWHNGLKFCLQNVLKAISKPITISLTFNMDGLPIFKSSKDEFWPVLFNINEMPAIRPMVVGVYHGKAKASSLDGYLTPFVDELKLIVENGIIVNSNQITVKIRCFVCDSPARAFVKGLSRKKHNYEYVTRGNCC